MNQPRLTRSAAALAVLLLTACGPKEPPFDQYDAPGLLDRGLELHAAEEWTEAIEFLDRFVLENPTHPRIQEARFYLADAYFGKEEYVTAAGRFSRLAEDYPNGEWTDDARFKVCESYRELAPEATLDQQYTQAAIDHCQALIVYHPDSEHVTPAREIVTTMENRLARKAQLNGEFYLKRRAYDSAVIYFETVVTTWPTSPAAPEALAGMIEAYAAIGYDQEAAESRERLLRDYPSSEAARELAGAPSNPPADSTAGTR